MNEPGEDLELNPSLNTHPSTTSEDWLNESFSLPENGFNLEHEMLRLIDLAISQAKGNVSEAARLLGFSRDYVR